MRLCILGLVLALFSSSAFAQQDKTDNQRYADFYRKVGGGSGSSYTLVVGVKSPAERNFTTFPASFMGLENGVYDCKFEGGKYLMTKRVTVTVTKTTVSTSSSVGDGLDEVNAKRAARGLRPFLRDEGLFAAARDCAAFRAQHRLFGHTSNDFSFLRGASARAAGCAAYPASYGWMSCAVYDQATYAGAAWVTGADGKRYMHLFIK